MSDGYRVAVVGATGAVGTEMRRQLRKRGFPTREIVSFASERSAGRALDGAVVQALTPETVKGFDLALFSAGGARSKDWAPHFRDAGANDAEVVGMHELAKRVAEQLARRDAEDADRDG